MRMFFKEFGPQGLGVILKHLDLGIFFNHLFSVSFLRISKKSYRHSVRIRFSATARAINIRGSEDPTNDESDLVKSR